MLSTYNKMLTSQRVIIYCRYLILYYPGSLSSPENPGSFSMPISRQISELVTFYYYLLNLTSQLTYLTSVATSHDIEAKKTLFECRVR